MAMNSHHGTGPEIIREKQAPAHDTHPKGAAVPRESVGAVCEQHRIPA